MKLVPYLEIWAGRSLGAVYHFIHPPPSVALRQQPCRLSLVSGPDKIIFSLDFLFPQVSSHSGGGGAQVRKLVY